MIESLGQGTSGVTRPNHAQTWHDYALKWRLMKSGKPAFSSVNHFEALSEDEEEDEAEKEVAGATGAASSSSTGFRRHA